MKAPDRNLSFRLQRNPAVTLLLEVVLEGEPTNFSHRLSLTDGWDEPFEELYRQGFVGDFFFNAIFFALELDPLEAVLQAQLLADWLAALLQSEPEEGHLQVEFTYAEVLAAKVYPSGNW